MSIKNNFDLENQTEHLEDNKIPKTYPHCRMEFNPDNREMFKKNEQDIRNKINAMKEYDKGYQNGYEIGFKLGVEEANKSTRVIVNNKLLDKLEKDEAMNLVFTYDDIYYTWGMERLYHRYYMTLRIVQSLFINEIHLGGSFGHAIDVLLEDELKEVESEYYNIIDDVREYEQEYIAYLKSKED